VSSSIFHVRDIIITIIMPKTSPTPPPPSAGFVGFLYNKERGEVLGRTGASWGKIGLFYVIYYSGLAAFFIALLSIFLYTFTDNKAPVLTGSYSVLPPIPGMGYQPMVKAEETLLMYEMTDNKTYKPYVDGLQSFLESGLKPDRVPTLMKRVNYLAPDASVYATDDECLANSKGPQSRETKPCMFNASSIPGFLEKCPVEDFGYEDGAPCIAVKMNRVFEFLPEIEGGGEDILVECIGEHLADKDNIGKVTYFPSKGNVGVIKKHFFPFLGQPHYATPLVFVKFEAIAKNILVQVMCRPTNLVNVKTDGKEDHGKVHFEVYITDKNA